MVESFVSRRYLTEDPHLYDRTASMSCCAPKDETKTTSDDLQSFVSEYYGKLLSKSDDLKTNACCATGAPPSWIGERLQHVHPDVLARFYGCGFPIPHAVEGAVAVDLGCGTGRDVYLLAQLVGAGGHVHGVDMTDEQLDVATGTEAWHADRFGYSESNVTFHKGFIEDLESLGIAQNSVDLVVSNCVVNLSPRKDVVFEQVYRALKPGGEFYFSDVVADRRLPDGIATDPVLYAECLGGAMYRGDVESLAKNTGFVDPRVVEIAPITINSAEVEAKVGAARFWSITYRLFKLDDLDDQCEDYGQVAVYKGGIPGAESIFWLDDRHAFEVGRPERVCANTASMLAETRLGKYFDIAGDKTTHYGLFTCGLTMAAEDRVDESATDSAACC